MISRMKSRPASATAVSLPAMLSDSRDRYCARGVPNPKLCAKGDSIAIQARRPVKPLISRPHSVVHGIQSGLRSFGSETRSGFVELTRFHRSRVYRPLIAPKSARADLGGEPEGHF